MQETALTKKHISLGAKMVPFAGYNMPVSYAGINAEHQCVRQAVGVFDVSHMGEFVLKGPGALPLIQHVTSNDASVLTPGKAQYSCLPNHSGGIVDDLLVYMMAPEHYMIVPNADNREKDWNWIAGQNEWGADMEDISDDITLLAVQGPRAAEALQPLTDVALAGIPYYHFVVGTLAGVNNVIISATGYTGAGGFELYLPNEDAYQIWEAIFEAGEPYGIQPIGLGARDTLRLEKGFALYGNDIDDETSPLEAGLGWITKLKKEADFNGKQHFIQQKAEGLTRKLVGFEMVERGIPRQHYNILNAAGQVIGRVTSGTQSPTLGKAIGMGYVQTAHSAPGSDLYIDIRTKPVKARVVKMPFL